MPRLRKTKGRDRPRHREVNPGEGKGMQRSQEERRPWREGMPLVSHHKQARLLWKKTLQGSTRPSPGMKEALGLIQQTVIPQSKGAIGELHNTSYANRGKIIPKSE